MNRKAKLEPRCPECGAKRIKTPSGAVCPNGHGRIVRASRRDLETIESPPPSVATWTQVIARAAEKSNREPGSAETPWSWRELLSAICNLPPNQLSRPVVLLDDEEQLPRARRLQIGKAGKTLWVGETIGSMPVLTRGDPVLRELKNPQFALTWRELAQSLAVQRTLDNLAVFVKRSTRLERWYLGFGDAPAAVVARNAAGDVEIHPGDACLFVNKKQRD